MTLFDAHRDDVMGAIWARMNRADTAKADQDEPTDADAISEALELAWLAQCGALALPLYDEVARASAEQAFRQVTAKVGASGGTLSELLDQADTRAIAWAKDQGAAMVGKKWVDGELVDNPNPQWAIEPATRQMLRDKIADALEQGWSRDRLAKEIQSDVLGRSRARMIAQTELGYAHSEGARIGWKATGRVTGRYVILSADHIEYDECDIAAEDGVVPLEEPYSNGLWGYPFHPRCECAEVAVVSDPDSVDAPDAA